MPARLAGGRACRTRNTPSAPGAASSPTCSVNATFSMNKSTNFQSRRDFLRLCGMAGLGVSAPIFLPDSAAAEAREPAPYEGPYYVVFNASGGWDTTHLMDPKGVNEMNRLYKEGDILTQGNHKFAPTKATAVGGMCNEDFYKEFGNELLVVNGIDYSINNHSPG